MGLAVQGECRVAEGLMKCDSSGSAENVGQDWDQGWCFLSPIHWGEQAERGHHPQRQSVVLEKRNSTGLGSLRCAGGGG